MGYRCFNVEASPPARPGITCTTNILLSSKLVQLLLSPVALNLVIRGCPSSHFFAGWRRKDNFIFIYIYTHTNQERPVKPWEEKSACYTIRATHICIRLRAVHVLFAYNFFNSESVRRPSIVRSCCVLLVLPLLRQMQGQTPTPGSVTLSLLASLLRLLYQRYEWLE